MKKIFSILFFTILIVKAFPYEGEKDEILYGFNPPVPEIATTELGVDLIRDGDSSLYWKLNLLNLHSTLSIYKYNNSSFDHVFDFEITPTIISKNWNKPYNFSFVNLKISYSFLGADIFPFTIKPFFGINYLNLKESKFDFNTLNLQAGVRIGIFPWHVYKDLFYFETGYAYKNNRHNYFFTIGISPFPIIFPYPTA